MDDKFCEKPFIIEKAKTGRAACKRCKQKCEQGVLRMAKLVPNFFTDAGMMKHWFHIDCIFESFKNQKVTSRKIESVDDLDGWESLTETERDIILEKLHEVSGKTPTKIKKCETIKTPSPQSLSPSRSINTTLSAYRRDSEDNLFRTFRDICEKIATIRAYTMKSETLQRFLIKGTNGRMFEGDIYLWIKMLLPTATRRIYNLQSKQLVKLFSRVFRTDQQEMLVDLEQGDVSETIRKYFESSKHIHPNVNNNLTLDEVDNFLDELSQLTKEDEQLELFQKLCKKCDADDLKQVIRLIKHDLRINAGPRHILDALNPTAYSTFQSSRDLKMVVSKFAPLITQNKITPADSPSKMISDIGTFSGSGGVQLMSPISPMLAEACKSVEKAILKNPEGIYSEIKYDGERVQIHKQGNEFKFFSRNLKPVQEHKIRRCKEFIPKAFPTGKDLILDSEIIMVNTKTGGLLPFGALGIHKREEFSSSEVCLFVFDCIYYNGEDLTTKKLKERKKILEENMKPIKNHVQLSEYQLIKTKKELALMTAKVLKAGLEGLVLKNVSSQYQPGKRGWLKIKKDYLFEGQMADTADLVVLGAWFGTGRKGGMLSIFLMGCLDTKRNVWKTVTKVHSGLDDNTMEEIQSKLNSLMERADPDKLPNWISCQRQNIPDYLAKDPIQMPVWEITGAEFTKAKAHTANGISIRFPRITRMRDDKNAQQATNLEELEILFKNSKENVNVDILFKDFDKVNKDDVEIKTKFFDPNKISDESDDEDIKMKGISLKWNSDTILKDEEDLSIKKLKLEKEDNGKNSKIFEKKTYAEFSKNEDDSSFKIIKKMKKIKDNVGVLQGNLTTILKISNNVEETMKNVKGESTEIFEEVTAFILPEALDRFEPFLKQFIKWGGFTTEHSRNATHVLHLHNWNFEDSLELRKRYQPTCWHLTYKWIEDSIANKKLMPMMEYAVML